MIEQTIPEELVDLANVQRANEAQLFAMPNVVGAAVGHKISGGEDTGEKAITVFVESKLDPDLLADEDLIPERLDDVPTDVVESGVIRAGGPETTVLDEEREAPTVVEEPTVKEEEPVEAFVLRGRVRPARGGYSVGHYRITAGTLGTCCYDLRPFPSIPRRYYILSNNHVLANSNNAQVGDPILQPGPVDGGRFPADVIARLSRWVNIRWVEGDRQPCNYADAAIAEGEFHDLDRSIYWIGHLRELYRRPNVGDIVQKTGRTTNFTTGRVQNVNATVLVNYGGGRLAKFCGQIVTTAMSAPGDSGSVVTNLDEAGVGLLFAGSPTLTILNHLSYVQGLLGIRVTEK